jgi:hypothetical protein
LTFTESLLGVLPGCVLEVVFQAQPVSLERNLPKKTNTDTG